MSELSNIFGGGAEHAHEQSRLEKVLPVPVPISADDADRDGDDLGVTIPSVGLPGAAIVYEPFRVKGPDEDEDA